MLIASMEKIEFNVIDVVLKIFWSYEFDTRLVHVYMYSHCSVHLPQTNVYGPFTLEMCIILTNLACFEQFFWQQLIQLT